MALTPAQLASMWTWVGTGISTIATKQVVEKMATKVIKEASKAA